MATKDKGRSKSRKKLPQMGLKEKRQSKEDEEEGGIGQVAGRLSVAEARRCRT